MRRYITTATGRALCHIIITALVLPLISVFSIGKAYAQIAQNPSWLVVEFVDANSATSPYGKDAAQKVRDSLANVPNAQYTIETQETIDRYIEELGLATPVTEKTSLLRLAAHARATTIVTGEVFSFKVNDVSGGRQADVAMRVVVMDASAGITINGAAVQRASSSVRSSSTEDSVLINEALAAAADIAVNRIQTNNIPNATVLNTRNDDALINRGARDGYKSGMDVLVLRGRVQVATGTVGDVEPDSANIRLTSSKQGIQPGDKVRPIFYVPDLTSPRDPAGVPGVSKPRGKSNIGPLITLLLVLGVFAFALGGGSNSNRVDAAEDASARPTVNQFGTQGIFLKWRLNFFFRSTEGNVSWQIWRNDIQGAPVMVVTGDKTEAFDGLGEAGTVSWDNFGGNYESTTCHHANRPLVTSDRVAPTNGRQYTYQIALIYRIRGQDLPVASNQDWCYFSTQKTSVSGLSTAYREIRLTSPGPDQTVTNFTTFTFSSVVNATFPTQVGYVLQFSDDPLFRNGKIFTSTEVSSSATTDRSITLKPRTTGDTFQKFLTDYFGSSDTIYWRVGVRNLADSPGPLPDPDTGVPYLFSPRIGQPFKRPIAPPTN